MSELGLGTDPSYHMWGPGPEEWHGPIRTKPGFSAQPGSRPDNENIWGMPWSLERQVSSVGGTPYHLFYPDLLGPSLRGPSEVEMRHLDDALLNSPQQVLRWQ